eukprot:CAMPEP_0176361118 /NCGR_PEP_ID=MMETSP0126-20121128/17512_1 /TAXON_ID=141414 ORGANISM="Strombidinopsis acuminatum, Strain SPMC142" /NCGR_SAMPLE_ID=MMETSP0126 /ASSEMBLY_ACC=CAM_ASM_000229 /LENGTH=92 /DNA_ID=CAMNT_0017716523 /DNA_START=265 /DNA_END=543 /DNA_ORIENTATION=-
MDKIRQSMEADKKAYCTDLKNALKVYANAPLVHGPMYRLFVDDLPKKIEKLEKEYDMAIKHIADVSVNAMGYLPKKYDKFKKPVVAKKGSDP